MKEKIINVLVIVVMVVIANYPLYSSLKATANDVNGMIVSMREEIAIWKREVEITQGKLEDARAEIVGTIDKGLDQTKNVLVKINKIESDIDGLVDKVDNIKLETVNKIENKVESLKAEPVETIKDLFKIKG